MSKTLIKICGITDPNLAVQAAQAGADFIGLIFHAGSRRLVSTAQAKSISQALCSTMTKAVAVFTEHSAAEMQNICDECEIQIVQLHGDKARAQHHLLANKIQRIYAQTPEMKNCSDEEIQNCDPKRDHLLFDHTDPGNGICFNWNQFSYKGKFKWFLAGGLNFNNIAQAIKQLKPMGIDVSSGVENSSGIKDIKLIKQFINEIHKNEI